MKGATWVILGLVVFFVPGALATDGENVNAPQPACTEYSPDQGLIYNPEACLEGLFAMIKRPL